MAPLSTEERWFVTDHEWKAANFDYAIPCWSSDIIKRDIHAHDHLPEHFGYIYCAPRNFFEAFKELGYGYGYVFTLADDILVFSDVDQSNPKHEEELRAKIAGLGRLNEPTEQLKAVREKLVQHLLKAWEADDKDDPMPVEEREAIIRRSLDNPHGLASSALLEFITTLDSQEEKQEALFLASGQAYLPASVQRPVIILVSVVDTAQTTTIGESRGYLTGYDVLANKLIIKPFFSNDERHFLADTWSTDDLPTDGISFSGTPADFIKSFHHFATSIPSYEKGDTLNAQGFKFLVWGDVAAWLHQECPFLFNAAIKDPHLEGTITRGTYGDAFKTLRKTFKDVPFPIQKKEAKGEDLLTDELDFQVGNFKDMVDAVEWHLRGAAVGAKEEGKAEKAEAAARMYGKVVEAVKEFEVEAMLGRH
ncbi:MAG: hypothetical protein LQ346_006830 [Caloplaca aetnensis]|nr:MAG: hypothetical protein LQ346_006830 [Caloplaca aetnensis]